MNLFKKRKSEVEEVEDELPQPANDETPKIEDVSVKPPDQQEEPKQPVDTKELDKEITRDYVSSPRLRATSNPISDAYSRRRRTQLNPREYQAYETTTSPKWIDIHFANGRYTLISHFDIKRVDSMTPEMVSICCSDCIIKLEGKNLHKLVKEFARVKEIIAFDDKKFDPPGDGEVFIEMIELKEI